MLYHFNIYTTRYFGTDYLGVAYDNRTLSKYFTNPRYISHLESKHYWKIGKTGLIGKYCSCCNLIKSPTFWK